MENSIISLSIRSGQRTLYFFYILSYLNEIYARLLVLWYFELRTYIASYKHNYPSVYDLQFLQQNMFVIPVAFSKEHKNMLANCKAMLEEGRMGMLLFIHVTTNSLLHLGQQLKMEKGLWIRKQLIMMIVLIIQDVFDVLAVAADCLTLL